MAKIQTKLFQKLNLVQIRISVRMNDIDLCEHTGKEIP